MVTLRVMQIAERPSHMLLVNSYVPAATKILSTALLLTAAVSSATLLTETWFSFRPCRTRGAGGARASFIIGPVGMLATAMDRWMRLRSTLRICHAQGVVRALHEVTLVLNVLHRVRLSHAPASEPGWRL